MKDGRTHRRTDGHGRTDTDESDFIGHCPTNVELPIKNNPTKKHVIFYNQQTACNSTSLDFNACEVLRLYYLQEYAKYALNFTLK